MFGLIRKLLFHLVAIALRAWHAEIFNRLEEGTKNGKEEKNEKAPSTSQEDK